MKAKRRSLTQRILAGHPTQTERPLLQSEINKKVRDFLQHNNHLPPYERENALIDLIKKIQRGQEDIEVLRKVVKSGLWLADLDGARDRLYTQGLREDLKRDFRKVGF